MADHDDLYRDTDEGLARVWEEDMQTHATGALHASVLEWSKTLRSGSFDPSLYRSAIMSLVCERKRINQHYFENAPEDIVHRLVAGQPVEVDRHLSKPEDLGKQGYGPIPTPVSYVPQLLDDLEGAGAFRKECVLREVGCGTGLMSIAVALMKTTRMKIEGLDWNPAAVQVARRTAESFKRDELTYETGRAQEMDLSKGDIFYLHSPFRRGSKTELDFCARLIREAESRPLIVATLYDVTTPFNIRLPQLNTADGYNGIALFGSKL